MTTQSVPLPIPVVRMPRGTAVSAQNGTGHLNSRLSGVSILVLAALAATVATVLMRIAL